MCLKIVIFFQQLKKTSSGLASSSALTAKPSWFPPTEAWSAWSMPSADTIYRPLPVTPIPNPFPWRRPFRPTVNLSSPDPPTRGSTSGTRRTVPKSASWTVITQVRFNVSNSTPSTWWWRHHAKTWPFGCQALTRTLKSCKYHEKDSDFLSSLFSPKVLSTSFWYPWPDARSARSSKNTLLWQYSKVGCMATQPP